MRKKTKKKNNQNGRKKKRKQNSIRWKEMKKIEKSKQ